MEFVSWIVFIAVALWSAFKFTKAACFLMQFVLPGGRQAYAFYFRRAEPQELAVRSQRRWRLLTLPWRILVATWRFLFTKLPE